MTIPCAWCGAAMQPGQPRSRLFATPDGSVRTTTIQAHFHPDCGDELLAAVAEHRDQVAERWTWARGPRAIGRAAA